MAGALMLAWRDRLLPRRRAPEASTALDAMATWLARAQDASGCDGVSAYYDLQRGRWAGAYPETTGYIIPTLFNYADVAGKPEFRERAIRMADWESDIQLPEGAVRAGTLDSPTVAPTIFNTGQTLFGWARTYRETQRARFGESLRRASEWLLDAQDEDGAWRRFGSPFTSHELNTYNTRTAYGLAVAAEALGEPRYLDAAKRNVSWALEQALPNGWLPDNCLEDNERPLTHTIAYAIRGILEVSAAVGDDSGLNAALKMAKAVAQSQRADGALPGRLDRNWQPAARWTCVTGNAQIAIVWLRLAKLVGDVGLAGAAYRSIDFSLTVLDLSHPNPGVRGGVKGSHPLDGNYMRNRYPNWAAKFLMDAVMLRDDPGLAA